MEEDASQEAPKKVSCDQEAWLKDRIRTAISMARGIEKCKRIEADRPAYEHAMNGIVEGTAIEIIHLLRMEPEFVNLRKLFENKAW